jgi:hypothetical protein|tara:strand:- start:192 stop:977 length:786 start_codon:yes stop_codon:yes gene_type:complete
MKNKRSDKVYTTKDYSMFTRSVGNRYVATPEGERRVKNLINSIREKYIPLPILADTDDKIIEGHHRLEAFRRLKMPFRFVYSDVKATPQDIQRLNNVSSKWSTQDYLLSNVDIEKHKYKDKAEGKPYHTYLWFSEKYKLAHRNNLMLLLDMKNSTKEAEEDFKHHRFVVKDLEKAKRRAEFLFSFKDMVPHINIKERSFVTAFIKIMSHYKFSKKRWLEKLQQNSRRLVSCQRTFEYIELILEIYNWKSQKNQRIEIHEID